MHTYICMLHIYLMQGLFNDAPMYVCLQLTIWDWINSKGKSFLQKTDSLFLLLIAYGFSSVGGEIMKSSVHISLSNDILIMRASLR